MGSRGMIGCASGRVVRSSRDRFIVAERAAGLLLLQLSTAFVAPRTPILHCDIPQQSRLTWSPSYGRIPCRDCRPAAGLASPSIRTRPVKCNGGTKYGLFGDLYGADRPAIAGGGRDHAA